MRKTVTEHEDFINIEYETEPKDHIIRAMGFGQLQRYASKLKAEYVKLKIENAELQKYKSACLGVKNGQG